MQHRQFYGRPHDARRDAGYGRSSLHNDVPRASYSLFPYYMEPFSEEMPEEDPQEYEVSVAIQARTNSPSRSHHMTRGRVDNRSFVKGQLMEDMTPVKGIVPFPFRTLYGKFTGHAVGGTDTRSGYTTAPGRLVGHSSFTNGRSVPNIPQVEMNNMKDLMDPGKRALVRSRLRIRAVEESDS